MTMDIDSPELRRERSTEMRDQDDSSIRERWAGGYDEMEEDGVEKPREPSKHRAKEKSKSSRREDKDHRSKDREQSKTSHGSKDREKEAKDLERDRLSGKDRRNDDNRDKQEKEKSHDKARENRERERDKERKDRGKEKERERERELDRDSERARGDKDRGKERSRDKDKDKDKDKDREKERDKHKEQGRGRENDRDRHRNIVDKEKGKERMREKEREVDQEGERQRDRDKGHKHWGEDNDKKKQLRKDDESGLGTIGDPDAPKTDTGLHDSEDGMVTLKHQQDADSGAAASELEERIMKMREERLKKSEGVSEVLSWVTKSRKIEERRNAEREKALQLSKIFEEQDNMNEGDEDEDHMQNASHELDGVKVLHGLDKVLEGGAVVLTLKDQSIISASGVNEEVDVLENVEIGEQKQRDDAYKAAKRKTGIYDDKFNDENGSERKILPQYDDPVADEGVTLDARGRFTGEAERKLEELRRRIQGIPKSNNAEDLNTTGKALSDYYTQEEMLKFKKPKKKKSLRKKDKLDIDALEAEAKSAGLGLGDLGSRSDGRRQAHREEAERNDAEMRSSAYQSALAKADEASKALLVGQNRTTDKDENDNTVIGDDDDDLRKSLDRARKLSLKTQNEAVTPNPLAVAFLASSGASNPALDTKTSSETSENKVVFTEMELWSQQLDEEVEKSDAEDVFMEEDLVPNAPEQETKEESGGWSEVKEENMEQKTAENKEEEIALEDTIHEVPVGRGLAGALQLLKDRGSLKETIEWGGRNMDKKKSKLVGIHDDDGPKEIHLERTDEYGRVLTPKEAFRLLSHKFHGKGPGKMKQEKRMRQYQEELKVKQMKNADTPSLSVERMKEAQAKLKSPYLVLTGQVRPGQTSDPRSGFATVEKDFPGGLTPMLGDKKVEYFLGKRKAEPGSAGSEKKPKT